VPSMEQQALGVPSCRAQTPQAQRNYNSVSGSQRRSRRAANGTPSSSTRQGTERWLQATSWTDPGMGLGANRQQNGPASPGHAAVTAVRLRQSVYVQATGNKREPWDGIGGQQATEWTGHPLAYSSHCNMQSCTASSCNAHGSRRASIVVGAAGAPALAELVPSFDFLEIPSLLARR
jgi:hypothetical protein